MGSRVLPKLMKDASKILETIGRTVCNGISSKWEYRNIFSDSESFCRAHFDSDLIWGASFQGVLPRELGWSVSDSEGVKGARCVVYNGLLMDLLVASMGKDMPRCYDALCRILSMYEIPNDLSEGKPDSEAAPVNDNEEVPDEKPSFPLPSIPTASPTRDS